MKLLHGVCAFSVLSDGSQARKTGSEKEIVLVRVLKDGSPTYFCVALQDMDEYGDTTAENLKLSIDDAFKKKIKITDDVYKSSLVCATADGASVNTGVYNGLLTRLQNDDRERMLKVHCTSHRVELAFKDTLLKFDDFTKVREFMILLYYQFKRSGRLKRQFKATAEAMSVQVYTFTKVHGTRFVNHQRLGLQRLLHNWIVLITTLENVLANAGGKAAATNAKLRGILTKLKDFRFLAKCCLYKKILDIYAILSLKFEKNEIHCFEIIPAVEKTKNSLEELLSGEAPPTSDLASAAGIILKPFVVGDAAPDAGFSNESGIESNTITQTLLQNGHMRRKKQNREYSDISYAGMTYTGTQTQQAVSGLMSRVLPAISQCLDTRFQSFREDIFLNMLWLDPAYWDEDNVTAEVTSLKAIGQHFCRTAEQAGYEESKVHREWKDFRTVVKHYYPKLTYKALWRKNFLYRRSEFSNVCLLAEIVMAIGVSNSVVEAGFSRLTSLLTDRRLSMSHEMMENFMLIQVNDHSWTDDEREDIITTALNNFMSTRRKQKPDTSASTNSGLFQHGGSKRQRVSSDSESDDQIQESLDESEVDDFSDHDDEIAAILKSSVCLD